MPGTVERQCVSAQYTLYLAMKFPDILVTVTHSGSCGWRRARHLLSTPTFLSDSPDFCLLKLLCAICKLATQPLGSGSQFPFEVSPPGLLLCGGEGLNEWQAVQPFFTIHPVHRELLF
jgi:hypothetical protein